MPYKRQGLELDDFPHVKRWFEAIAARPATIRADDRAKAINTRPVMSEEAKRILFGQTAEVMVR